MELDNKLEQVVDHATLGEFIRILSEDLIANQAGWENRTLDSYLERLAAFVGAMKSWARNNNLSLPDRPETWRLFGEMLLIAKEYE
jgi:hypothetical protein